jgi:hypothetical protein
MMIKNWGTDGEFLSEQETDATGLINGEKEYLIN